MILDSNIIIYANEPENRTLRLYLDTRRSDLQASLISKLEVLGFPRITRIDKQDLTSFVDAMSILPIDEAIITEAIITEAIRLRQQRKRSLDDSIIAATALLYNLPLLTNNVADFSDIDGLQVVALADVLSA